MCRCAGAPPERDRARVRGRHRLARKKTPAVSRRGKTCQRTMPRLSSSARPGPGLPWGRSGAGYSRLLRAVINDLGRGVRRESPCRPAPGPAPVFPSCVGALEPRSLPPQPSSRIPRPFARLKHHAGLRSLIGFPKKEEVMRRIGALCLFSLLGGFLGGVVASTGGSLPGG
jgi:hypothetical protein